MPIAYRRVDTNEITDLADPEADWIRFYNAENADVIAERITPGELARLSDSMAGIIDDEDTDKKAMETFKNSSVPKPWVDPFFIQTSQPRKWRPKKRKFVARGVSYGLVFVATVLSSLVWISMTPQPNHDIHNTVNYAMSPEEKAGITTKETPNGKFPVNKFGNEILPAPTGTVSR